MTPRFPAIREAEISCLYWTSVSALPGTRTPNLLIESPYATLTIDPTVAVNERTVLADGGAATHTQAA